MPPMPHRPWTDRLPFMNWARGYNREALAGDGMAAFIVTVMLIPQSLAYTMLAGLPPEVGLYASMTPALVYALLGTSRVLAVGPVAVVSLMTAAAIGQLGAALPPAAYWQAALALALLSGLMLLAMGALRLGFLANFLSHPVISGFVSASGILITLSQLKHLLGIRSEGNTLPEMVHALWLQLPQTQPLTLALGAATTGFLFWVRKGAKPLLMRLGLTPKTADMVAKAGPVVAIAVTTVLVWRFGWHAPGNTWSGFWLSGGTMKIVGHIPQGLPPLTWPEWNLALWKSLWAPALMISVVGFVESVSVGQTLAAKRRQRITPNQELLALGASNVAAGLTGGYPVTGGFSRSVVNFDAGAQTPAAGMYTAGGLLLASLYLTPALYFLPQATLAATIIVAVISLVDLGVLKRTWVYAKADFAAVAITLAVTLLDGVEGGLVAGVSVSLLLYLWRTSRPHMAVVGRVPGTEHFRNVLRHTVECQPHVLGLRVDESLYFANARTLEDRINLEVAQRPELRHVVLLCSAINDVDASALESLEAIDHRLKEAGLRFHLSEVKGPVMDRLQRSGWLSRLSGQVFLTHHQAVQALENR